MIIQAGALLILLFPTNLLGQQSGGIVGPSGLERGRPIGRTITAERTAVAWSPTVSRATTASTLTGLAGPADWPRWVRWGLIGAAAGAVTLPVLSSLARDDEVHLGRAALAGALSGFVIVGGSIAIWDALCAGNTRSRRAGLCGRQ